MTDKIKIDMLDLFSTDRESEEAGTWIFLDEAEEVGFKIRALGAKAVLDLRDDLTKKYQSLLRAGGKLPDEKVEEINLKVIAGGVLADWKGIVVGGEEIPYSADNAYAVLSNPKLGKMAGFIAQHSTDAQNYRDGTREDAAKN
ncbi:tail assembly chaperone [Caulobacter phage CcrBL10]|uniref:Pre-tape measure chaperone protein n=1 Tax=Caulobacter phage CcrBL10 TaxID=2283269 RepID=A0A385E8X2_9CAUD|nr:tail assembly chaperone [Caulobacter phage CcrBL10]AXQ68291.1 pre-tape measure chaperone protein [Caulobacter phage CcrBL10]